MDGTTPPPPLTTPTPVDAPPIPDGAGSSSAPVPVAEDIVSLFHVTAAGMNKYWGTNDLKKHLTRMGIKFHSARKGPRRSVGYVSFLDDESLQSALVVMHTQGWTTEVQTSEDRREQGAKNPRKRQRTDEADTGEVNVVDAVTPLWQMAYEDQIAMKRREIEAVLWKMPVAAKKMNRNAVPEWVSEWKRGGGSGAGVPVPIPFAVHASPVTQGYRNKVEFSIGRDIEGSVCVGFQAGKYRDGVLATSEPVGVMNVPDAALTVASLAQSRLRASTLVPFDKMSKTGFWRTLMVRVTGGGEVMVAVEINPSGVDAGAVASEVAALKDAVMGTATSFFVRRYTGPSVPNETHPFEHVAGTPFIEEALLSLKFAISPGAFFQTNTAAAGVLYGVIGDMAGLDSDTVLLDLCCGTGTIGICLAGRVSRVIGIELVESAVLDAKANAERNGVTNAEFICGKVEDTIGDTLARVRGSKVVAILDPPRGGMHGSVLRQLRKEEGISRLVYVACNPKTVPDTCATLCSHPSKKYGGEPFRPSAAAVVDMFPHTRHVELVVQFSRET